MHATLSFWPSIFQHRRCHDTGPSGDHRRLSCTWSRAKLHWRVLDAGNPEHCLPVELEDDRNKMQILHERKLWSRLQGAVHKIGGRWWVHVRTAMKSFLFSHFSHYCSCSLSCEVMHKLYCKIPMLIQHGSEAESHPNDSDMNIPGQAGPVEELEWSRTGVRWESFQPGAVKW